MKPMTHVILSTASSAILYGMVRSLEVALGCLLIGIFIDIDHFLDYFMTYRRFSTLRVMYRRLLENRLHKFYLILHSYEIIFFLWFSVLLWNRNEWIIGVAWGMTVHLLCDQIAMSKISASPAVYLLTYRMARNFRIPRMLKDGTYKEVEED
ncbi:MAG: hypothetical protein JW844_02485 [Candidatus Omnitrophica bacterium]|nr:hypothetical protein [Candidatus Omnitrophota bacterium]